MPRISKKITGYKVKDTETPPPPQPQLLHEDLPRPEWLVGSTYKIKGGSSPHALYVTVNDMQIEDKRIPYEVFINSKDMAHFQWVSCLTRLISALFRKGGNIDFIIDEMKAVVDPKGGYFRKGTFVPSDVAAIGLVLEQHLLALDKRPC